MQKCHRIGQISHAARTPLLASSDESAATTRGSSSLPATTRTHLDAPGHAGGPAALWS